MIRITCRAPSYEQGSSRLLSFAKKTPNQKDQDKVRFGITILDTKKVKKRQKCLIVGAKLVQYLAKINQFRDFSNR